MYGYEDIREVHLEITSRCNASCPQCPRNLSGGATNPALPLTELSLSDVRAIFPTPFLRQLSKLYMCGNYGDPMVARDTLAVFEHLRAENPAMELGMFTNGSGRAESWWSDLAKTVTYVRFGIDGLRDTNHIYRRGTSFERVLASARAFIDAGGRAEWDFIVFRHNEHQIEEARLLARELGFQKFFVKKTSRFFSPTARGGTAEKRVLARDGSFDYAIEEPLDPRYRNQAVRELSQENFQTYQATCDIRCKAETQRRIYVSAEGLVFPCCWTGSLYPPGKPTGSAQMWDLIRQLPEGIEALRATRVPLASIVGGRLFQELLPSGWAKRAVSKGRLEPCVRSCGAHDTHAAQYGISIL